MSPVDVGDSVALVLLLVTATFSITVQLISLIALLYWFSVWLSSLTLLSKSLILVGIVIALTLLIYRRRHEKKIMVRTNDSTAQTNPVSDATFQN
jgi:Na+/melibiose symporter-like transporter